jgi:hypothetical protein
MIKYDNVLVLKINKYFLVTRFSTAAMGLLNDEGNSLPTKLSKSGYSIRVRRAFSFLLASLLLQVVIMPGKARIDMAGAHAAPHNLT